MKIKTAPAIVTAAIILITAIVVGFLFFVNQDREPFVAEFGDDKIYLNEYYVYLYEMKNIFESIGGADIWDMSFDGDSAENVAKQNALNSVVFIKISANQSKKMGISISENEKIEATAWSAQVYESLGAEFCQKIGLDLQTLTDTMLETELYKKLFDHITASYEISEAEFEDYAKNYGEENNLNAGELDAKRSELRETFASEKMTELYRRNYDKWSDGIQVIKNRNVYDGISIFDLVQ